MPSHAPLDEAGSAHPRAGPPATPAGSRRRTPYRPPTARRITPAPSTNATKLAALKEEYPGDTVGPS